MLNSSLFDMHQKDTSSIFEILIFVYFSWMFSLQKYNIPQIYIYIATHTDIMYNWGYDFIRTLWCKIMQNIIDLFDAS